MFEGGSGDSGPPGSELGAPPGPPGAPPFMGTRPPFRPPFVSPMGPMMRHGPPGHMRGPPFMGGPRGPPRTHMPPHHMMGSMMAGGPPMMPGGMPSMGVNGNLGGGDSSPQKVTPAIDPSAEIWVETRTKEGKLYFFNAKTRASAWTRPTGEGVQVLTQEQVEQLAKSKASKAAAGTIGQSSTSGSGTPKDGSVESAANNGLLSNESPSDAGEDGPPGEERPPGETEEQSISTENDGSSAATANGGPPGVAGPPGHHSSGMSESPQSGSMGATHGPMGMGGPLPHMMRGPGGHMGPYRMRPPFGMPSFGGPPFGMPPGGPHGFNQGGFPGGPPPFMMMGGPPGGSAGGFAGGAPPGMGMYPSPGLGPMGGSNMGHGIDQSGGYPPGAGMKPDDMSGNKDDSGMMIGSGADDDFSGSAEIDHEIRRKADEWKEYKTPEGKSYYHSAASNTTQWEKPQALIDFENEEKRVKELKERMDAKKAREVAAAALANPALAQLANPGGLAGLGSHMSSMGCLPSMGGSTAVSQQPSLSTETKPDEKPRDKTKPVSSTPVPGTPWCVVWTGDEKVFFFNPTTKSSVWERPLELLGRADVDKLVSSPPSAAKDDADGGGQSAQKRSAVTITANTKTDGTESPQNKRARPEDSPKDKEVTSETDERLNKPVEELVKEDPMAAEKKAARERALVPLEERMAQFSQMLVENEVSAFSTWEKELHKIVFDPRYLLLLSKERKQVFEKYCKDKVEEERKEKKNKAKQLKEAFKELLVESNLSSRNSFSEFASKHGKDDRFKGVEKMRDRESLFNDHIAELKRREREEKSALKDKLRRDFMELLKEQRKLDRYSSWTRTKEEIRDDPRYQAIESSSTKEDYFREYCSKLSKSSSNNDRSDRGNGIGSGGGKAHSEAGERSDSEERQKKERIEASLRQREKEVAETLSSSLKQRDREREMHRREEAVQSFQALLTDLVRTSDMSWHDAKKILKKDHRYAGSRDGGLDKAERERLFDEHVSQLKKKKKDKFKQMLAECTDISLNMPFSDARKYIKDDPRFAKYSSSEHKCEKVYKDWMKDQISAAKNNFRSLLAETKLITYKSKKLAEESESHLKDILKVLENDRRFLVLSSLPEERTEILTAYIDELDRKGVPPPPTASDPQRRNK